MALIDDLPEGITSLSDLGIAAEIDDIDDPEGDENLRALAELVTRCVSVLVRHAAQQPDWTRDNVPHEARIVDLTACRRILANPQNQQRIQTGPLSESYHVDELTGMELKDSEEELLATFIDPIDGDMGSLGVVEIVRPDPIQSYQANYKMTPVLGLGGGNLIPRMPFPSLAKYLGVDG